MGFPKETPSLCQCLVLSTCLCPGPLTLWWWAHMTRPHPPLMNRSSPSRRYHRCGGCVPVGSHSHHGEPWGSGSSYPGARVPRGSLVPHILRVRVPRVSMAPCIPGLGSPGVSLLSVIPQVRIPSPGPPRDGVRPPGSPHPSRWCDLGCPCGALSSPKVPGWQQPWVGRGFVGDPIILRTGVCALVPGIRRCLGFSPVPWGHLSWGSPRVPVGVPGVSTHLPPGLGSASWVPFSPGLGVCSLGSS